MWGRWRHYRSSDMSTMSAWVCACVGHPQPACMHACVLRGGLAGQLAACRGRGKPSLQRGRAWSPQYVPLPNNPVPAFCSCPGCSPHRGLGMHELPQTVPPPAWHVLQRKRPRRDGGWRAWARVAPAGVVVLACLAAAVYDKPARCFCPGAHRPTGWCRPTACHPSLPCLPVSAPFPLPAGVHGLELAPRECGCHRRDRRLPHPGTG